MLKIKYLLSVLFALLFIPISSFAAPEQPADVRILVDISGSMKQTDPENLRIPAVNLLIELLPEGAQAGIWTFGQQVNMLVPLGKVDNQWRQAAKKQAKKINSVGLYTNLRGVLDNASWNVKPDSGFNHSVILLTDGHIDMRTAGMPANTDQTERDLLLQRVLPKYVGAGAQIHTLGLSDEVDKDLLKQLSSASKGLYLEAHTADDLLPAFLKAFNRAVPAIQVPMFENQFSIDGSVKEFTALVFRKANSPATRLIAPDGQVYTAKVKSPNIRWHQDLSFDLITIKNPRVGDWKAEADVDPKNRVQILTDLKLNVSGIDSSIFVGSPIQVSMSLTDKGQTITKPEVLRLTDFRLTVVAPDGRIGSKTLSNPEKIPASGIYSDDLSRLSQEGEYQFEVTAIGRTFQRQQVITASLLKPLKIEQHKLTRDEQLLVIVRPERSINTLQSRVTASVVAPSGEISTKHLSFDENTGQWELRVKADQGEGQYRIALNLRGVLESNTSFKYQPDDILVDFPLAKPVTAPAEVAAVSEEPQPQPPVAPEPVVKEEPKIELDLAADYAKQQDAFKESETPQPNQQEASFSWVDWLLMGIISLSLAGVIVLIVYLMKSRKAKAEANEAEPQLDTDKPTQAMPDDLIQEDFAELSTDLEEEPAEIQPEIGEFSDYQGEEEMEILAGDNSEPASLLSAQEPSEPNWDEPDVSVDDLGSEEGNDELAAEAENEPGQESNLDAAADLLENLDEIEVPAGVSDLVVNDDFAIDPDDDLFEDDGAEKTEDKPKED
ncbi:MAG: VWA domain-containing protein [Venatoribacter sp.]